VTGSSPTDWHKFAERLAKLLEMLRSPFDGERLAATERMNSLLDSVGLTYTEYLKMLHHTPAAAAGPYAPARRAPAYRRPAQTHEDRAYCELAAELYHHPDFDTLGERSANFVEGLSASKARVTAKQRKWLDDIARQMGVAPLEMEAAA
jgi:hypothetical protein